MASEDDFSDLTDLDELSDEYDAQPAKRKGKGKGKGKTKSGDDYRLHGALKAPRATTYSTEALYKQIHNGDIDLDPEYQREVVWPEAKQIGIIDSIYRNFYIPPVIFAVKALDDGTETRTCIDGKQRLTSIHRFVEGLIPHKDSLTGEKMWYRDNPAHRTKTAKRILSERFRTMFNNKAVVCVEYNDLRDQDEREIFQRVQLGVALTPAEKLKVLTTPRARFVRGLQEAFLNSESAGLGGAALAWDRSRGSDFRCLSQTIQCIALSPKTTSIQATEKWLADPAPMVPAFAKSIEGTYRVFERLVQLHPKTFTKIAPVEFISVGILVHRHKERLTLAGLAGAVTAMRADVRNVHDDIRNNGKVYKTMSAFIDGYRGPAVGQSEVCAADAVGEGNGGAVAAGSSAGTKRKAAAPASDDDSDDDYAPARRAPVPRKRASPTKLPPPTVTQPPAPPTPPMSAPPPGSPPQPSGMDALRAAKEKIAAMRQAAPTPMPAPAAQVPPPPPSPYSFNPDTQGGGYPPGQGQGPPFAPYGQQYAYQQQQQQQQQQQSGAAGVAAALELMGAASAWGSGTTPNGTRVKTEPGSGPPPFSAGSNVSGSGSYGRGRGDYHRDRDRDRDRDHRDRDWENGNGRGRDYDEYDRGDKRYHRDTRRGGRGW